MAVHQIEGIESYLKYLQQTPTEVEALFCDLLIGVTNFFRDPEAFKILETEIIPKLFADKQSGGVARVWSTGCSTGEEAYSIAILLQEHLETLKQNFTVQVFATDIDSRAIATARAGLYPVSIAADITSERLSRFFTATPDGSSYRINKGLRDMLIFSEQNLIKDPPFSRLDLISCRNLMIYFDSDLQKKIIPLFNYALNPGGFLLLGTSEGIGEFGEMFAVLDRKVKLFQRKEDFTGVRREVLGRFIPSMTTAETADAKRSRPSDKTAGQAKMTLREMTEQALLQQVAPAAALVNAQGDLLYLHGRTGMYLEPSPGETGVSNILKMAREGLRPDLSMALHKADSHKENVKCNGLNVKTNGHFTRVNVTVRPVIAKEPTEAPLYLIILEEAPATEIAAQSAYTDKDFASLAEARIDALKDELRAKDEYLQSTHELLESSNEELKSSNEEMQSVNEELQSTNEELETSKEELQSVNEELATVNAELQIKVTDLSRANNDMNNLLAGTGIGTVFVDHQLHILRFTPAVSTIINLIPSDVGRPVAHIASNLIGYDRLVADTQEVLNTLALKEIDVQTMEGKWYTMRIQPYRTLENVIEGAVISFVNVTEVVQTRDALQKANELLRLAVVVRDAHDAIAVQDLHGRILAWNPSAVRIYGWSESEALRMNAQDRIPEEQRKEALSKVNQLKDAEILEPYRTKRLAKDGSVLDVWMTATALLNEAGQIYAIATTERVITGGKR
jgi:two-component system CheB/CheR fusion protein